MKKIYEIISEMNWTIIGLLFAWICFTGSARTIGLYLMGIGVIVHIAVKYLNRDEE